MPRWRRAAARTLESIQSQMVVVISCRKEYNWQVHWSAVDGHCKPDGVTVERDGAVKIRNAQMNMANPHARRKQVVVAHNCAPDDALISSAVRCRTDHLQEYRKVPGKVSPLIWIKKSRQRYTTPEEGQLRS
jgi:hypothetical protein